MGYFVRPPVQAPRRSRIASGASKTTPGSPKDDLQALQDAPKAPPRRLQDGPRHPQDGTNCAQLLLRPPRNPPSFDFGPLGLRFWTIQTSILDPLYVDFQSSRPELHPFEYRAQIENRKIDKMQLCYFSFWRGGGDAALLRVGYFNIVYYFWRCGRPCLSARSARINHDASALKASVSQY